MLPIILREDLCTVIKSTQKKKGLSKVSEKLFKDKKNDDLYTINKSAIELRPLTLDSFNVGVSAKLFAMDISTAQVFPLTQAKKRGLSPSTKNKLPTHYLLKAENGLELPSLVLLEQLRTIDKRRLEHYIGRLDEHHIRRVNRALAISVGLIEEVPKNLIMCLCPACANNFYGTGSYYLRRVNPKQEQRDICTYCGQNIGYDYEVVKKPARR